MGIKVIIERWSTELCMSISEIARESELSNTTLYKYMNGDRQPVMKSIRKLREFARTRGLRVPEVEEFIDC